MHKPIHKENINTEDQHTDKSDNYILSCFLQVPCGWHQACIVKPGRIVLHLLCS